MFLLFDAPCSSAQGTCGQVFAPGYQGFQRLCAIIFR